MPASTPPLHTAAPWLQVYPLPFIDRISEDKADRAWDAVWLENEYVRLAVLTQLGGRIHVGQDRTNGAGLGELCCALVPWCRASQRNARRRTVCGVTSGKVR